MSFWTVFIKLLNGFGVTCELFFLTLLFALPLGLLISFGSMSRFKPLKVLTKCFVWIIRGTPLMLQVMIVFYVPGLAAASLRETGGSPELIRFFNAIDLERFTAVVVAFVINYACYFSEIYRGGIESISKGQHEAGFVLGLTKGQIFSRIILMQVVKRVVPPMSNEIITLVKDTSLARVIAVIELIKVAEQIVTKGIIWPLFFTAVFYLLFSGILTLLFGFVEKKLSYYKV